jgi:acetoin utilization deacetylase AcuC-like enzyme
VRPAALFRSPSFQEHDPGPHPENPHRLVAIDRELERLDLIAGRPEIPFEEAGIEQLTRVHDRRYIDLLHDATLTGGGWLDGDTFLGPTSLEVAKLGCGAAIAAVDAALDGVCARSFVLARPPGHHATPVRGMGFCLLNTIAVAAEQAKARGLERVLIVDWDVHHGNGTQDAFYEDGDILFFSTHQSPHYPGTGMRNETGTGAGQGRTINVPLPAGQGDDDYLAVFDEVLSPATERFRPELVLVSAGFDAHRRDPLGGMRLTAMGFARLAQRVVDLADRFAQGRVVAVLEGGYDPEGLAGSVSAVLRVLDGDETIWRSDAEATTI